MRSLQALFLVAAMVLSGCEGCRHEQAPPVSGTAGQAPKAEAPAAQAPEAGKGQAPAPPAAQEANEVPEEDGDCIVVCDANPDYGPPPLAVELTAEAECTSGQPTYKWDFGDGSPPSTEVNPKHTYTKVGDYVATVTVTGPSGSTSSDEIDITVEEEGEESE